MPRRPPPDPVIPLFTFPPRPHRRLLAGVPFLRRTPSVLSAGSMDHLSAERTPATLSSGLRSVRWTSFLLGFWNLAVALLGGFMMVSFLSSCPRGEKTPFASSSIVAVVKIIAMIGAGKAQHDTAVSIANCVVDSAVAGAVVRQERRIRYKRWLWWTRFGMFITVLQFIVAGYLMFTVISALAYDVRPKACILGPDGASRPWKKILVISFAVLVWLVGIIQCFTGADILRWRSFYATHDTAWKAHYREVFDHGIREALCCLGRDKYLTVLDEDEVYSVARLLGDLVAYRASGTGHLELLAGLALLQIHKKPQPVHTTLLEAPDELIQNASFLHHFAEAAYTGPLLDFGRNPILFPCAWLYRQGIFTPWSRNRWPLLEGDNWWRGHAAAFLKYVNLPPEALRRGRVCQTRREAAYFIVVLHAKRSVIIAVRGTETPEDLITDGLGRECTLTTDDLDGLIKQVFLSPPSFCMCECSQHLPSAVRQRVLSSFPHYGHAGIIESARELFAQVDGQPGSSDDSLETFGFLSSLLGEGCECQGYEVQIVGHSLGGAIATLLGLRLYKRYPNLKVYAYGSPPCLDLDVAEACSDFVTTIVYNDEFSSRLSVNSILRLRAAAINALSDDSLADSAMIHKLARRILNANKYHMPEENSHLPMSYFRRGTLADAETDRAYRRDLNIGSHHTNRELHLEAVPLCNTGDSVVSISSCDISINGNIQGVDSIERNGLQIEKMDNASTEVFVEPPEMYLPGCLIHIVREQQGILPFWRSWKAHEKAHLFRAFVAKRENFTDIAVTPFMFIDHLPWRCHYAMQRVLEARKRLGQLEADG